MRRPHGLPVRGGGSCARPGRRVLRCAGHDAFASSSANGLDRAASGTTTPSIKRPPLRRSASCAAQSLSAQPRSRSVALAMVRKNGTVFSQGLDLTSPTGLGLRNCAQLANKSLEQHITGTSLSQPAATVGSTLRGSSTHGNAPSPKFPLVGRV